MLLLDFFHQIGAMTNRSKSETQGLGDEQFQRGQLSRQFHFMIRVHAKSLVGSTWIGNQKSTERDEMRLDGAGNARLHRRNESEIVFVPGSRVASGVAHRVLSSRGWEA